MSPRTRTLRTQPWLDGSGDWSWPGRERGRGDFQLPSWIPALPPRFEPAIAGSAVPLPERAERSRAWWLGVGALLSLAVALIVATVVAPHLIGRVTGVVAAGTRANDAAQASTVVSPPDLQAPLPTLRLVSRAATGSSIDLATFRSASLGGEGSFFVYLPPGYASATLSYPVLYLLHGQDGHASAFLEIGIQRSLDRLIAKGAIPPIIAVMIQDQSGLENWQDLGARHSATYVIEVQELIDRMLRTISARAGRAIAGSSKGGFGAMNVALANPLRFEVVESWLGYFNHLEGALRADRSVISRLGLHAFLYGATEDTAADPAEDPAFASRLRATGAQVKSAIYPGGHSLEQVREHLETGLLFAGRSLLEAEQASPRASSEGRLAPTAAPGRLGPGSARSQAPASR